MYRLCSPGGSEFGVYTKQMGRTMHAGGDKDKLWTMHTLRSTLDSNHSSWVFLSKSVAWFFRPFAEHLVKAWYNVKSTILSSIISQVDQALYIKLSKKKYTNCNRRMTDLVYSLYHYTVAIILLSFRLIVIIHYINFVFLPDHLPFSLGDCSPQWKHQGSHTRETRHQIRPILLLEEEYRPMDSSV